MATTWLTADLHFGHQKEFVYAARGFTTVEEMDKAIIRRWNRVVKPEDEVFVLGDLCLGGGSEEAHLAAKQKIEQLNGNLHIVLGNHDSAKREEMYRYLDNVVEVCWSRPLKHGKWHFYLSHYPTLCGNWGDGEKPLKARTINLCGHTHTTDRWVDWEKAAIYHVEMDAHNCTPVRIDDIIEELRTKA